VERILKVKKECAIGNDKCNNKFIEKAGVEGGK
jgi:hypothetical protein